MLTPIPINTKRSMNNYMIALYSLISILLALGYLYFMTKQGSPGLAGGSILAAANAFEKYLSNLAANN